MKKIAIMGAGGWGCALAILLNKNGHEVKVWSHTQSEADIINLEHENKEYLSGVKIPEEIYFSSDSKKILDKSDYVIIAVPSKFVRQCMQNFLVPPGTIIINVAKGMENSTFMRMSQVISETTKNCEIATLSGPTHAEEVSRFLPTACVIASENPKIAIEIQKLFNNDFFRAYTSTDIIGVELGGTLKNIIALAAGISDGLGFGDNTKAALINRGIFEIARLGKKLGACSETFYGLSGLGDLVVTCMSRHSRNRRAGFLLGQGFSLEKTLEQVHMVVEGVNSARAVYDLSQKLNIEMPIITEIYKVLYKNKSPRQSVIELMSRQAKSE